MNNPDYIAEHQKCKHLIYEDYILIELWSKDRSNAIATKELHSSANTVRNIIKKGMTSLYNGKVYRFKAKTAWKAYQENRSHSCRNYDTLRKRRFIKYVVKHFKEDGWSLDACANRALMDGGFTKDECLCTKSLYNYVDLGLIQLKNIDLPQKLRRKTKKIRDRQHRKNLGRSIEERPDEVNERTEFGHWEADLVVGSKSGEDGLLLTLIERKTRELLVFRIPNKSAESVNSVFQSIKNELQHLLRCRCLPRLHKSGQSQRSYRCEQTEAELPQQR